MIFNVNPSVGGSFPIANTAESSPSHLRPPASKNSTQQATGPENQLANLIRRSPNSATATDFHHSVPPTLNDQLDKRYAMLAGIPPIAAMDIPAHCLEWHARSVLEQTLRVLDCTAIGLIELIDSRDIRNDKLQMFETENCIAQFLWGAKKTMTHLSKIIITQELMGAPSASLRELLRFVSKNAWKAIQLNAGKLQEHVVDYPKCQTPEQVIPILTNSAKRRSTTHPPDITQNNEPDGMSVDRIEEDPQILTNLTRLAAKLVEVQNIRKTTANQKEPEERATPKKERAPGTFHTTKSRSHE